MKKVLLLALAISLVAASIAFAGVAGSLHDLGTGGIENPNPSLVGTGQVCVFCHHPHRGQVTVAGSPLTNAILWNITDWSVTAYPVYDDLESNSFDAVSNGAVVNDGSINSYASYFCMACHDGTVGDNALVRKPRDTDLNTTSFDLASDAALGDTLEDDHPVNFEVTAQLFSDDGELNNNGSDAFDSTKLGRAYPLFGIRMQCSTCHDVHRGTLGSKNNCGTDPGASCDDAIEFMLGDTVASEICTDCHVK